MLLKPAYPVADLYRIETDDHSLALDFVTTAHGIPSFEGLRKRATAIVRPTRKGRLEALRRENDRVLDERIGAFLSLPPEKRTHFLRKRVGLRMSCI
jgi:hypothetical protein